MERFWKVALGIAGIGAIGFFVFWSLYKQWLTLPIFPTLTQEQAFELLRYFLFLTFAALALAVVAYVVTHRPALAGISYVPVKTPELSLPNGSKFTDQQFETYKAVWLTLGRLRRAGDALWQLANKTNLKAYVAALRETIDIVGENGIFFHSQDYSQLQELLRTFANYRLGKEHLIGMRSISSPTYNRYKPFIERMIEDNKANMLEYSNLLEQIRETYHDRLSWTKVR